VNNRRLLLCAFVAVLAVGVTASGIAVAGDPPPRRAVAKAPRPVRVNPAVTKRLRAVTWRWQSVMGVRHSRLTAALNTRVALRFWARRASVVRRIAANPPHRRGWLCIHRFEGRWSDSGDPYWGGLQMDRGFMSAYAPRILLRRGWADRWSSLEQMWVAERAHRSGRGYGPWPNTARLCGLL
jgi:hypothetical protein